MTTIYLIRHAEADGNLYRRAHGWYDSVITDRGYRQIAALAKRFENVPFDAVYSSDRRRTMTTALSVYKTHGLPLVTTPRMREIGIGVWEDHPWAELERTDGEQLERFNTDAAHWHVAGGEYLPDVRERMIGALREILQRTGMLENSANIVLPGDVVSPSAKKKSKPAARGVYDRQLVEGVKRFQAMQGLGADGVIGQSTRDWLNVSSAQRAGVLALNIQRLRLLPGKLSTGIMVNIPAFSLVYYQDGSQVLASRVIVGRPDRKTPMMSSALNNVVVNPPWNVPPTLARKDILPKVRNNPGYLEQHGYTVMRGWNSKETIDPYRVDWSTITENNLPFRFQQAPAARN